MKRISAAALAVGVAALVVSGCGPEESTDPSGLRKGTTATATSTAAPDETTGSAEDDAPSGVPAGPASEITCAEFRALDIEAEQAVIEQILAEHPDSPFAGSPNVALGTAKLVCLSDSVAGQPVATAAGLVAE